jgi:hypothetical protein
MLALVREAGIVSMAIAIRLLFGSVRRNRGFRAYYDHHSNSRQSPVGRRVGIPAARSARGAAMNMRNPGIADPVATSRPEQDTCSTRRTNLKSLPKMSHNLEGEDPGRA